MTRRFGLALGACAIFAAVSPAFALDPPTHVRLFHYADGDVMIGYVDFKSLDRSDPIMLSGWTYSVYTPPKPIDGLEKPIGSYWEKFDADCGTYSIISHGIVGLTPDDAVIFESPDDQAAERRDVAPGTFEDALLKLICSGKEPKDANPFATAAEAERVVRVTEEMDKAMDGVEEEFGNGLGGADDENPFAGVFGNDNDAAPPK
ncbi:MAG TPA: hypothetical protein VHA70_09895 [Bauldia sp.]|nr:hypothetical protein [Bauldia sp.]